LTLFYKKLYVQHAAASNATNQENQAEQVQYKLST